MPNPMRPYLLPAVLALMLSTGSDRAAAEEETAPEPTPESSETSAEPPVERVMPDPEQQRFKALARQSELRELIFIAGAGEEALALYHPDNSGDPKGAALILHGEEAHPDWPVAVGPLRRYLPDYGWATLSIALPNPGAPEIPQRTLPTRPELAATLTGSASGETDGETEPGTETQNETEATQQNTPAVEEAPLDPFAADSSDEEAQTATGSPEDSAEPPLLDQINTRIQSGLDYLRQQGHERIVLIGHDIGAAWATQFAALSITSPETPLVLISPRLPRRNIELDLLDLLSQQRRPVLDLYFTRNSHERRFAKRRRDAMQRHNRDRYRQTRLAGHRLTRLTEDKRIVQRVRGWLKTLLEEQEETQGDTGQGTASTLPGDLTPGPNRL